jgi:hypothetical protein
LGLKYEQMEFRNVTHNLQNSFLYHLSEGNINTIQANVQELPEANTNRAKYTLVLCAQNAGENHNKI